MRDLTIRGAGDLLGPHQSGFIDTVGIDMYIEMLEEAIQKKTHPEQEEKKPVTEKHANVSVSGYIPKNFSANDYDKLDLYHQIENIRTREELDAQAEALRYIHNSYVSERKGCADIIPEEEAGSVIE